MADLFLGRGRRHYGDQRRAVRRRGRSHRARGAPTRPPDRGRDRRAGSARLDCRPQRRHAGADRRRRTERVAAVGLCGQVNTDTFVDATGQALAPAIAWADNRAAADAAALDAAISPQDRMDWWGARFRSARATCSRAWPGWRADGLTSSRRRRGARAEGLLPAVLCGATVSDAMSNFFVVGLDCAYVEPLVARVPERAKSCRR